MVRTRVGYAGGTTPDPTYRTIGDHTETVQVDFDPAEITYDDLLAVFWASHTPLGPPRSRQYASRIFAHDDGQRAAAEASRATIGRVLGPVSTTVEPFERFYLAEDYHQKYRLRGVPELAAAFGAMYPDESGLRESTAAARVNGYLYGCGTAAELDAEIGTFGLSDNEIAVLRRYVRS